MATSLLAHGKSLAHLVCPLNAGAGRAGITMQHPTRREPVVSLRVLQAGWAAATRQKTEQEQPNNLAGIRRHAPLSGILRWLCSAASGLSSGVAEMTEEFPLHQQQVAAKPAENTLNVATAVDPNTEVKKD
ncbi:MAG: hypothetical protein ACLT2V_01765 [Escherichia coli]